MKKKLLTLLMALIGVFTVFSAVSASAETKDPLCPDTVRIMGTGKITVAADTAEICLGIQVRSETAAEGFAKMNETYKKICAAVKTVDKNAADSVTSDYSYGYPVSENGLPAYEFSRDFRIRTKKLNSVDKIAAAATEAGAVRYNGIYYSLEDDTAAYARAMALAVKNAKAKAETLCKDMKLTGISETDCYKNVTDTSDKLEVVVTIETYFSK